MTAPAARIGCAGWSLARSAQPAFGEGASLLQRYATRLPAVEINSSFYRPHQAATYARWAAATPAHFRFSVKLPKTITHVQRLVGCEVLLDTFLDQVRGLKDRLGCLLVQLPPSLAFDPATAAGFLRALRRRHGGAVAMEPRHASWFTAEADALLQAHCMARVLADPVLHDAGRWPGGWPQLVYLRLHGSPRAYWSSYDDVLIEALAHRIRLARAQGAEVWCIFDNTASGAATHNALALQQALTKDAP
ncbi:MAG: DUF72 domain-containing protein [Comamonadaceae bacterium]|nr:MAG: DUF72 domain-containing protein [Comamonadaceae bacterium]